MTDEQRDPEADEAEAQAQDAALDEAEDEIDMADEADEAEDADDLAEAPAAAPAAAASAPRRGKGKAAPVPQAAPPSVSEQAVHVDDRFSSWFVIAMVAIFVAILAYGVLLGRGGIITDVLATPKPVPTITIAPSPTATPTAAPSASASAAPSAAPSASPSAAPSATPAAS